MDHSMQNDELTKDDDVVDVPDELISTEDLAKEENEADDKDEPDVE